MSRPSFQFYPDDWMNDLGLRLCSLTTRAIWMDMLCLMHQGVPYGHLAAASGPLPMGQIASRANATTKQVASAVAELEQHKVFSRTAEGIIYSRRMVRDEHNRTVRGNGGKAAFSAKQNGHAKPILPDAFEAHLTTVVVSEEVVTTNGKKEEGPIRSMPLVQEFPETAQAVRGYFPAADDPLIVQIAHEAQRTYVDVVNGRKAPPFTDLMISEAIHEAHFKKQESAGAFLRVVPRVVRSWTEEAIRGGLIQ